MAILNSLLNMGESRLLGKVYLNDIDIGNDVTVANDLTVGGDITNNGTLSVGKSTAANAIIYLNDKLAIKGTDAWLRINETKAFTSGIYTGTSIVRSDSGFQVGNAGAYSILGTSGNIFKVPTTISYTTTSSNKALTVNGDTNISGSMTAGTVNATEENIGELNVENANVYGTLRAAKYSIETVQNLGGHFLVCPTIEVPSDSTGFSCQVTKTSSTTLTIGFTDNSLSTDTFNGTTWTANSKVKVSGMINNVSLGTCNGTISSWNKTNKVVTVSVTCEADVADNFSTEGASYPAAQVSNLSIMMYEVYTNNTTYPIGIYLTAYGRNKYSYIDVYGGTSTKPTTRMGKLDGLDEVNNTSPTGWGFYSAQNGYFQGTIVSSAGKIGGFTIGSDAIYSSANALGTTANNVYVGTEGISLGTTFKVTKAGALTATSGKIGNWNLGTALYSGTNSMTSTTVGTYLGTDGIRNYKDSDTYVNIKDGVLTAEDVDISGKITSSSGKIANWNISSNDLYIGTWGEDNSAMLCTGTNASKSVGGSQSINGWVFTAGANFGVTKTGALYANSAKITGDITATSLTLGDGVTLAASDISGLSSVATSGSYSSLSGRPDLTVYIQKDGTIGTLPAADATSSTTTGFKVSSAGLLTASNALIYGAIYASEGKIGSTVTIGDTAASTIVSNASNGNSAYNRSTAYQGTCGTAAGTAAKVVTCTNFKLVQGATVTVYNTTAQTNVSGAITLNVNSTGAKTIYVNGAATAAANQLLWAASSSITFTYDGTYWRVQDNPGAYVGTACSVAANTAAKTSTVNEIIIFKGTTISIPMDHDNTNTSATLNITSLGAKNIYYGTGTTRPTTANGLGWLAGTTTTFIFDGQYWRTGGQTVISGNSITTGTIDASKATITNINASNINSGTLSADRINANSLAIGKLDTNAQNTITDAAKTSTNFIVADSNGIMVADMSGGAQTPSAATSNNVLITKYGIVIRDKLEELATFEADGATIGNINNTHLEMDYHSFVAKDNEDNKYFEIIDLRNEDGIATFTERFAANYDDGIYTLSVDAVNIVSITAELQEGATMSYTFTPPRTVNIGSYLLAGDIVEIKYTTETEDAKAYTLGSRQETELFGLRSTVIGVNNVATGYCSLAAGQNNTASGKQSFVIGGSCEASGWVSFAGGFDSHADQSRAFAYGYRCFASGYNSMAIGYNVTNLVNNSLVCGRWNDPTGTELFVVGNGSGAYDSATDTYDRSNAFGVYGNGDVYVSRKLTAASGQIGATTFTGNAIPDATETRYLGNTTYRWQNLYTHYVNASAAITAGSTASYTATYDSKYASPSHCDIRVSAGICTINYMGPGTTNRAVGDTIFTLPAGCRPAYQVTTPMTVNAVGYGTITINTNGVASIGFVSNTTTNARIYFNCSFAVV